MVARRVEQITSAGWVQIEEDTRHNDDLLLQTRLEEVQTVTDLAGETLEIQPQVESRVGNILDVEAHLAQTLNHVVTLGAEVGLQSLHLLADEAGLEHRHRGLLEGRVGATVQVGTARADGLDELLGAHDPSNTPAWQTEALGETVDNEDVVLVDVLHIVLSREAVSAFCTSSILFSTLYTYSCRNCRAITVGGVVVAAVELVADEGCATTANILDLSQLWVLDHTTRRVTGIGGQNHTGASCNFLGDLVRVDVVTIVLMQRNWNSGELKCANISSATVLGFALSDESLGEWHRSEHVKFRVQLTFLKSDNISLYAV